MTTCLPDELLLGIFRFVDALTLYKGVLLMVCRRWRRLAKDPSLDARRFLGKWKAYEAGLAEATRHDCGPVGQLLVIGSNGIAYIQTKTKRIEAWTVFPWSRRYELEERNPSVSIYCTRVADNHLFFCCDESDNLFVWNQSKLITTVNVDACGYATIVLSIDTVYTYGDLEGEYSNKGRVRAWTMGLVHRYDIETSAERIKHVGVNHRNAVYICTTRCVHVYHQQKNVASIPCADAMAHGVDRGAWIVVKGHAILVDMRGNTIQKISHSQEYVYNVTCGPYNSLFISYTSKMVCVVDNTVVKMNKISYLSQMSVINNIVVVYALYNYAFVTYD